MVNDLVETLTNRLSGTVNRLNSLTPLQKIQVQTLMARTIKDFVEEKEDPFKDLTDALGPTFSRLREHEAALADLLEEYHEKVTKNGKMVKDAGIRRPVTVRSNHRIVLREFPIGTVVGKTIYRKRDDSIKGVMLEVI